jgi:polysaccharide export outer membrane protein
MILSVMTARRLAPVLTLLVLSGFLTSTRGAEPVDSSNPTPDQSSEKSTSPAAPAKTAATDPSYRLSPGDNIIVTVTGQADMSASETLSRTGDIRLPMITEEVKLSGKTVREAEHFLDNLYRDKKLLKAPVVRVMVAAYSPREVSVIGAVRSPGTVLFPRDTTSMDVVEVITKAGGFLPISKADAVTITHRGADGKETVQTVDLENVISGRRKMGKDRAEHAIYPGDRIFVPERIF